MANFISDEDMENLSPPPAKQPGFISDHEMNAIHDPKYSATQSAVMHGLNQASAGFSDELSGLVEAGGRVAGFEGAGARPVKDITFASGGPTLDWETLRDAYKKARDHEREALKTQSKEHPWASAAGDVAGMVVSPLNKVVSGTSLVKGGAALGAVNGLGSSDSEDLEGMGKDTAIGMGAGAALGFGAGKAMPYVEKGFGKVAPTVAKMLPLGKKANAAEIEAAAEALGTKATPGMTNASESLQKLESSLNQAPTVGGWLTRRGTKPVNEAMQNATRDLTADAATISPYESGEQAKKIMSGEIQAKFKPHADAFNDLAESTKNIPSTPTSVAAVSRNIMNIPEVQTLELPLAKQIVRQLENNPSADQIKMLRGIVGKQAAAADGAEASGYWQIYAKLGKLEENTIKRGAISSARKGQGESLASDMLGQLKGAKQGWAEQMGNLGDLSEASRIKGMNSPSSAIDKINAIPSERFQERMLPLEDNRLAQTVQKQFPQAFPGLKSARLRDLSEGTLKDGKYLPGKFLQNTKGLNPEAESMLFGDKAPQLKNLRTVNQALPDKVGPSGTQQAFDVKDMLNPLNQAKDLARYGAYKYSSSESLAKVAEFLKAKPQFAALAERNPEAFNAMVLNFSQRSPSAGAMPKAAGGGQQDHVVSEDDAKQQFLDGN